MKNLKLPMWMDVQQVLFISGDISAFMFRRMEEPNRCAVIVCQRAKVAAILNHPDSLFCSGVSSKEFIKTDLYQYANGETHQAFYEKWTGCDAGREAVND